MNYINHLNAVFRLFAKDSQVRPTHISLYIALFQLWNRNRFPEKFYINRGEVMIMSKIGSMTTYYNCMRRLHDRKYITYSGSHDPLVGGEVVFTTFQEEEIFDESTDGRVKSAGLDTGKEGKATSPISGVVLEQVPEQPVEQLAEQVVEPVPEQVVGPVPEQVVEPYININKQYKKIDKPIAQDEVLKFFSEKGWKEVDGNKFFNYYQSTGWKTGRGVEIKDWKAAAENWILRSFEIKRMTSYKSRRIENLKTTKDKDYGEPL